MSLKISALAAVAAAMLWASAATASIIGPFTVDAEGTATQADNVITITATVTDQDPIALDFTDLLASLTMLNPSNFEGTFVLSGPSGDLFANVVGVLFDQGGFTSTAGSFVVTSGTGQFAGLTGEGTFASLTNNADGFTRVLIGGTLVPVPGVLAVLMAGGLVTGRRRRRAA